MDEEKKRVYCSDCAHARGGPDYEAECAKTTSVVRDDWSARPQWDRCQGKNAKGDCVDFKVSKLSRLLASLGLIERSW